MTLPSLSRLRQANAAELTWRARALADIAVGRTLATFREPTWDRRAFAGLLDRSDEYADIRETARAGRWLDAHKAVASYLHSQPSRFVISPQHRQEVTRQINEHCPTAVSDARRRANRLLAGKYDLLGYTDLDFDGAAWHRDPVHRRSAPIVFWSTVPYLEPDCGDHKVIWEFNRHQHWMQLGRAYWLTGDTRYRAECLRQLRTWMDANPPLMGINWASMLELAFRSLSWLWTLNLLAGEEDHDEHPWMVDLLLGLDRQLTHVERHLSYYFSPNTHLLGEALALYVCGRTLPLLRASARRETLGRRVLLEEIGRQISADGGHCERSPHYHRYTLDFYLLALTVARLTEDPVAAVFERACVRLAHTARLLADDRGMLPLIGDDDGGSLLPFCGTRPDDVRDSLAVAATLTGHVDLLIDVPHESVFWLAGDPRFAENRQRLERAPRVVPPTSAALAATGYYISRNERGDHLVIDGGAHGYLNGGHAHADALSVTFAHQGRPLFVDTGTGVYSIDSITRDRFRSTAAHNTLMLNGRSQSIPRGPFHWASTADAITTRWRTHRHFDYFTGMHCGYAPLEHHRHVFMLHGDLLVVADCVVRQTGADVREQDVASAAVHWHLHPDWSASIDGSVATLTQDAASERVNLHVNGGRLEAFAADTSTGLGWFAPVYGRIEPTITLRITREERPPFWTVSVIGLDKSNAISAVDLSTFSGSDAEDHDSAVVTIARSLSTDRVRIAGPDDASRTLWRAGGIESDGALVFTRETDDELVALALVDGQTVRSVRHAYANAELAERAGALFIDLTAERDKRKAS